jgi:hypothetical protein
MASRALGDDRKVTSAVPPMGLGDQFPSQAGVMVFRAKM